ncbi:MAG: lipopolysaccharide biosynthesis protein, partial [Lachnospiraceae bacterium]|nr:lipopolysaccharide biosynthesis protein [Lachnospiraceae bacterium]
TVSNANLQAMRALGRSDVVLKLEFIKKPIGLLMILLVVKVNVLAIAITMPIYSLFAAIINMQPNRRLMGYKFREQVYDLAPAIVLTLVMAIVIYPLNYISLPNHIILLIQIIGGILVYVILSVLFHVDSFQYLLEYGKNKLKKHNRRKLADAF